MANEFPAASGSVVLDVDDSGITSGLANVQRKLTTWGKSIANGLVGLANLGPNVFGKLRDFSLKFGVALGGISAGLTYIIKRGLETGSAFQEIQNKFSVVFQGLNKEVEEWIRRFSHATGRGTMALMRMMSWVQDFLVPMGFARDQAAQMSQTLAELATDISSFSDVDTETVLNLLLSGLTGITRAVRQFGIDISDAAIDQWLMKEGIEGGSQAATQQQKVIARLNIMLKNSKDAQGDAIRTADTWANSMRAVHSQIDEVFVALGDHLIPLLSPYLVGLRDALRATRVWIEQNPAFVEGLVKLTKVVVGATTVAAAFAATFAALAVVTSPLGALLSWFAAVAVELGIIDIGLEEMKESLAGFIEPVKALGKGVFDYVLGAVSRIGARMIQGIRPAIEWLKGAIGAVMDFGGDWIRDKAPAFVKYIIALTRSGSGGLFDWLYEKAWAFMYWLQRVIFKNLGSVIAWIADNVPGGQSGEDVMRDLRGRLAEGEEFASGDLAKMRAQNEEEKKARLEELAKASGIDFGAGKEKLDSTFDAILTKLEDWSKSLSASGDERMAGGREQIAVAIEYFKQLRDSLIQSVPPPEESRKDFPLSWAKVMEDLNKKKKGMDNVTMWGYQDARKMMGAFGPRDVQKEMADSLAEIVRNTTDIANQGKGGFETPVDAYG